MVWFNKREIIGYLILVETFGEREFSVIDARVALSQYFSPKVSKSIVSRLMRIGMLERDKNNLLSIVPCEKYFKLVLLNPFLRKRSIQG